MRCYFGADQRLDWFQESPICLLSPGFRHLRRRPRQHCTVNEPLIAQGLELMLVGMGTVFVFLTALVAATRLMSALVLRRPEAATPARGAGPTSEEIAAITAAVARHRGR